MIDAIIRLWNASPVNPAAVAVVGWVVWKLYSTVGPKVFLALGIVVGGAAIFWNGERVLQILTWLGAAYVVLMLFGVIDTGGGGSTFRYTPTPDEGPRIPHGAPPGYNPYIQPPGAHPNGYNPDHDPDTRRWDGI